jgi:aldose 1-epimerase
MQVHKKYCFTNSEGEDIYLFTLRHTAGTEVCLSNYGAIITSWKIGLPDKSIYDIVLGFENVEDYFSEAYLKQYPWFGCAIGRCANRIKDSSFELDGKKYFLTSNRGNDHLHGGISGFDKKVWKVVSCKDSPYPSLELSYLSRDGEEGYPGNLKVTIRFDLYEGNALSYEYTAACDKPTVVNLARHEYFNLGNGKKTIENHFLKINSSVTLDQDENLVANGNLSPVENTAFDFRDFHPIGTQMNRQEGYDKSYLLDAFDGQRKAAAEAYSEESGIRLQVFTDQPVVHFYSGRWIPELRGKNSVPYGPFSGFCLETHIHPNAVNIPHFPNVILRPGEVYRQKTVYKVSAL